MRTLPVDIEGLDLVLGGGFSLLERVAGAGESTTLLIRGPAGSGKTVVGTQFATSIARALGTDVAYACIELLPAELRAQHENIKDKTAKEKVVVLNEHESADPGPGYVRIYAGLLDLGENGRTVERFGDSLEFLLDAANARAGRVVRVVVVDSLSDGYGLGSRAPRVLADGVSKLAAMRGLVVILLEEQADEGSSVWSFAVDTVFELKPAEEGLPFERRLFVPKNRLGPSDPGPHEFTIREREGMAIHPRANSYQRAWRNDLLQRETPAGDVTQPWYPEGFTSVKWLPNFRRSTISVVGEDSADVKRLAWIVGSKLPASMEEAAKKVFGPEINFRIGMAGSMPFKTTHTRNREKSKSSNFSWSPVESGATALAKLRRLTEKQYSQGKTPLRVIMGDLRDMRHHANPSEFVQSVAIIASLLRDVGIPLILYETTGPSGAGSVAAANASVLLTYKSASKMVRIDGGLMSGDYALDVLFKETGVSSA